MELDLFGNIINKAEKKRLQWSPSKRNTLHTCSRQYYYNYYGSNKTSAPDQPFKDELYFQKSLTNKYQLAGKIIHQTLSKYFRDLHKDEINNASGLIDFAHFLLDSTIQYSIRKREDLAFEGSEYNTEVLAEIFYETENIGSLNDFFKTKIDTSIENFFSTEFQLLRKGGAQKGALIEKKISCKLTPTLTISGVLDLGFFKNGYFHLCDWKTGALEFEETSLQLLIYAFWAHKEEGIELEKIRIGKAYLLENQFKELGINSRQLLRARVTIEQDVEDMRVLDEFGRNGNFAAFGKCNQSKICNLCPYEQVCIKN